MNSFADRINPSHYKDVTRQICASATAVLGAILDHIYADEKVLADIHIDSNFVCALSLGFSSILQ